MQDKTIMRELVCILTDAELAAKALMLSESRIATRPLIAQRKRINDEIKGLEEQIDILSDTIHSGQESREIECKYIYDWQQGVRWMIRTDTGAAIEPTELIPAKDKQMWLDLQKCEAAYDDYSGGMFARCADMDGCPYCKSGNVCAPSLCGNNPDPIKWPALTGGCNHPETSREYESNAVICTDCGTVLELSSITRQLNPDGCEILPTAKDCEVAAVEILPAVQTPAEGGKAGQEQQPTAIYVSSEPPRGDRKCCFPEDRDVLVEGDMRYLYCRVCGRVPYAENMAVLPWAWSHVVVEKYTYVDLEKIGGVA